MNELYLRSTTVRHAPRGQHVVICIIHTTLLYEYNKEYFSSTHHRNGELILTWNNNHAQLFQSSKFLLVSIKLLESLNCYIRKAYKNCILGVNLPIRSGSRFSC